MVGKPLGMIGGVIVLAMLAAALLADWIAPYGYAQTSLRERFISMSAGHWLGTDELGRDLLTRLIYGARISLYVGFGAIAIGSVLATMIGVVSGYLGGRFDLLVQRGVDAWMAFPPLLLLLSIMSLLGPASGTSRSSSAWPSASRTRAWFAAWPCWSRSTPSWRARAPWARATCARR